MRVHVKAGAVTFQANRNIFYYLRKYIHEGSVRFANEEIAEIYQSGFGWYRLIPINPIKSMVNILTAMLARAARIAASCMAKEIRDLLLVATGQASVIAVVCNDEPYRTYILSGTRSTS